MGGQARRHGRKACGINVPDLPAPGPIEKCPLEMIASTGPNVRSHAMMNYLRQYIICPPQTFIACPVMPLASSEAR